MGRGKRRSSGGWWIVRVLEGGRVGCFGGNEWGFRVLGKLGEILGIVFWFRELGRSGGFCVVFFLFGVWFWFFFLGGIFFGLVLVF